MTSRIRSTATLATIFGLWVGLLVAGCGPTPPVYAAAPPEQPAGARTVVIISDLHLGLGHDAAGRWDPFEDFRWAPDLQAFLSRVDQDGHGATDLIINGDMFELWQSRAGDCRSDDANRGCSRREALQRVRRVLGAHRPELQALGHFAASGDNRVVIVPGNHDAALLFPEVSAAVVDAAGAPAGRLAVAEAGYWISRDRRIYADHGQQLGTDPNRYDGWPTPFRGSGQYLQRTGGEYFVQSFYDAYEDRYPLIDNLSHADALRFAIAREGIKGLKKASNRFLAHLVIETSWTQKAEWLAPPEGMPQWDLAAVRRQGNALLLASMPQDDELYALFRASLAEPDASMFDDATLLAICDARWIDLQDRQARALPPAVSPCPTAAGTMGGDTADVADEYTPGPGTLGGVVHSWMRSRRKIFGDYLRGVTEALRRQHMITQPFEVYAFGHTHDLEQFDLGLQNTTIQVVNSGAWNRSISGGALRALQARRGLTSVEVLEKLSLDDLPACYGVVQIAPYTPTAAPVARASFYRPGPGGGVFAATCD